ncbi:MAG: peptide chain release factor N(5)-glutamine methyltransferase [Acidimicrobiia bacterium]|nr:peptide chain release factor N(5)-glutamine methyltransferase [Acidimicrobiia bacterium]
MSAASTWRQLRAAVTERLSLGGIDAAGAEARWLCEEASGYASAEWPEVEQQRPSDRSVVLLDSMVTRRLAGEPLQYVIGSWSFRGLDLMVDRRVLIPRPETEWVVEVALQEAVRLGLRRGPNGAFDASEPRHFAADLGTGSGAIALALEAELPEAEVWATDVSEDALAVARANLAGCVARRVRTVQGSWFEALPTSLRGRLDLVVTNPPYVSEPEVAALPPVVADHEPRGALVSGPTGLEALNEIISTSVGWLTGESVLVCEIAPRLAPDVIALARSVGFAEALVREDLAGRDRVLVARWKS